MHARKYWGGKKNWSEETFSCDMFSASHAKFTSCTWIIHRCSSSLALENPSLFKRRRTLPGTNPGYAETKYYSFAIYSWFTEDGKSLQAPIALQKRLTQHYERRTAHGYQLHKDYSGEGGGLTGRGFGRTMLQKNADGMRLSVQQANLNMNWFARNKSKQTTKF